MPYTVLIVDDEELILRTISNGLRQEGFEVLTAASGEDAVQLFTQHNPDIALVDVILPGMNGIELLREIKGANSAAVVIMMSAHPVIDQAVEAMELGAFHYLGKPFRMADLLGTIKRATEVLALRVRVNETVETAKGAYNFGRISTQNGDTSETLERARKAADSDHTTILIQGESGTGKGVLARAIHYASPRASMPLLELNCATLPDTLLESELFGFEAGAFTDARHRKKGLLERAHGGTVFLDEIGNMSPSVQAKVLQVLEDGTFWRLGGTQSINVDVRLIAATNVNLKEAISAGQFREDLFYRLNVVPLSIPPLRRRKEDILSLALEMMEHFNRELGKKFTGFTPAAAHLLRQYPWPGNIRELKNAIEHSMILSTEGVLDADDLPEEIRATASPVDVMIAQSSALPPDLSKFVTLRELEDDYIEQVLAATGNNKSLTARILGIHPTSLLRRFKKKES
ncbi:MAG: sigma-54 dependent transcriptional regulator [Terriglobia bacterium]|jgi:two-component system response regulator AtoC|nr:sigma-54 dependent transcriptional regulator [Terriglobia bacterium]